MAKSFVNFECSLDTGKTKVFQVSNNAGIGLGVVKWFAPWRRYVFYPGDDLLFDVNCLNDISDFMHRQMVDRAEGEQGAGEQK